MARSDKKPARNAAIPSAPQVQMRVDPPHVVAGAPTADVDVVLTEASEAVAVREAVAVGQAAGRTTRETLSGLIEAPAESSPAEQLQLQAEQLAARLGAQQEQIDRREADLNAQLAKQEHDARSSRLWLRERQQEFAEREAELARREQAIAAKEEELARADREQAEGRERAKSEQRRQSEAFAAAQRELDERQRALERQETENAAVAAAQARTSAEQTQLAERLKARQRNLEEAEVLLADSQAELAGSRRQFESDRQAWHKRCEATRKEMEQSQARNEADFDKKLHGLKARADRLERRAVALDQLRAEVLRAQREALELRLATDEVWAQMIGIAPPAALSQSLAQVRGKLAEHYRAERAEIAGEKKELELLATRADQDRQRLQQRKQELDQWAADRQADLEGQAARLLAREQQLDRRQTELDDARIGQADDRREYEREIRRLLGELRRDGATA
jgi:hypothetical protein